MYMHIWEGVWEDQEGARSNTGGSEACHGLLEIRTRAQSADRTNVRPRRVTAGQRTAPGLQYDTPGARAD